MNPAQQPELAQRPAFQRRSRRRQAGPPQQQQQQQRGQMRQFADNDELHHYRNYLDQHFPEDPSSGFGHHRPKYTDDPSFFGVKYEPCRFFWSSRGCRYGDRCQYQHTTTYQCVFGSLSNCPHGARCNFHHNPLRPFAYSDRIRHELLKAPALQAAAEIECDGLIPDTVIDTLMLFMIGCKDPDNREEMGAKLYNPDPDTISRFQKQFDLVIWLFHFKIKRLEYIGWERRFFYPILINKMELVPALIERGEIYYHFREFNMHQEGVGHTNVFLLIGSLKFGLRNKRFYYVCYWLEHRVEIENDQRSDGDFMPQHFYEKLGSQKRESVDEYHFWYSRDWSNLFYYRMYCYRFLAGLRNYSEKFNAREGYGNNPEWFKHLDFDTALFHQKAEHPFAQMDEQFRGLQETYAEDFARFEQGLEQRRAGGGGDGDAEEKEDKKE